MHLYPASTSLHRLVLSIELGTVQTVQPERLTRLGNSNVQRLPVFNFTIIPINKTCKYLMSTNTVHIKCTLYKKQKLTQKCE